MTTLPLTPVVDVFYNLDAISTVRRGYNLGAIIGTSRVITQEERFKIFTSVDEMIDLGFSSDDPEVQAAQVYFAANSNPGQLLVGKWAQAATSTTSSYDGPIGNGNLVTIAETTYTVGDGTSETTTLDNIVQAANTAGATSASHTDDTLSILFTASTSGSSGTVPVLQVAQGTGGNISQVINYTGENAESALEALQAIRSANNEWYACAFLNQLEDEDILSIAAYIEVANPTSTYFAHSNDYNIINGVENNLFSQLKGLKYNRTIGTATNQPYTHVGIMGYAMGQTRDTADSSFTLGLKEIPGTSSDNYTSTEVNNVESNNGNVYINRGSYYDLYEPGKVFSGAWYDEIIQLDRLVNEIQLSIMDLIYPQPKIPQTNDGMAQITSVITRVLEDFVTIGFIAPGQWNGGNILNLENGTYLPSGYLIQNESFESQSQADRDARKAPNVYVAIKLAGAIQSVVVQIDVNR